MNAKGSTDGENLKDIAQDFLRLAAAGNVDEAYRHVSSMFRHHNPYFRGDAESLKQAMRENARKNPNKQMEIQHSLQDGNLVAVHSRIRHHAHDRAVAVMHLFRFNDDRIEELWDIGQAEPETMTNEFGMF
jgi:predicted SnoaL-like aldol condensation-catalyzing enzyme